MESLETMARRTHFAPDQQLPAFFHCPRVSSVFTTPTLTNLWATPLCPGARSRTSFGVDRDRPNAPACAHELSSLLDDLATGSPEAGIFRTSCWWALGKGSCLRARNLVGVWSVSTSSSRDKHTAYWALTFEVPVTGNRHGG